MYYYCVKLLLQSTENTAESSEEEENADTEVT